MSDNDQEAVSANDAAVILPATPPLRSRGMAFLLTGCLSTLLLLILSLAWFDYDEEVRNARHSWEFYAGVPHWFTYSGVPLDGRNLPTLRPSQLQSGPRIDLNRMAQALGWATLLGSVLSAPLIPRVRRASWGRLLTVMAAQLFALIAAACFGYHVVWDSRSELPQAMEILFLTLPLVVVLLVLFHRSYLLSLYLAALAVLVPAWGLRIGWMLRPPQLGTRPTALRDDDVGTALGMIGFLAIASCFTVAFCRLCSGRRGMPASAAAREIGDDSGLVTRPPRV